MQLKLKSFNQLVQDMTAALQGAASALIDVSVGSVIRAIFEANAGIALWIQWLLLQVLSATRAATCVGDDLDSWMADFGLARLAATPASGIVTLSRYSSTVPVIVATGTLVKSVDGASTYAVVADPGLSTWQPDKSGYVFPAGVASIDLPVCCLSAGSKGNVVPGAISIIASSLPGVDQVTNQAAFTNGLDIETDEAFRARFRDYLAGLSKATLDAVYAAAVNVRQGLSVKIAENVAADGSPRRGSFVVVVDDGSGYPDASLLSAVADAIEVTRPIGTTFSVVPPAVEVVNVTAAVRADAPVPSQARLQQIITSYVNQLPVEGTLSVTRLAQSIYTAELGVTNVSSITLNGSNADINAPLGTVFKVGQIAVTISAR